MSWSRVIGTAITASGLAFIAGTLGGGVLASGAVDGILPDLPVVNRVLGVEERQRVALLEEEAKRLEEEQARLEEEAAKAAEEEAAKAAEEEAAKEAEKAEPKAATGPKPKPRPKPRPAPAPTVPGCTSGALTSAPASGSRVEIVGVSKDDAFFSNKSDYIGAVGTTSGLSKSDGCYFSGSIQLDDGRSPYFYQVAVKRSSTSAPSTSSGCPSGALTSVSAGDSVKILQVHSQDAFYSSRSMIEGKSAVANAPSKTEGCWWGGTITTSDGTERYFYKVALGRGSSSSSSSSTASSSTSCPSGALRSVSSGQHLKIARIHPDDAYYTSKSGIEGKAGTNTGLSKTEDCWFGGPFIQDDGTERYFYKAAFTSAPAVSAGDGCPAGALTSSRAGQRVRVLKVHSNDAYYSTRSAYEGQSGTVVDVHLQSGTGCFFGGTVKLDNGNEPYFYMAALGAL